MPSQKFKAKYGIDCIGDIVVSGLVDGVDLSAHVTQQGNGGHVPLSDGNNGHFLRSDGGWGTPAGTYAHPNHTGDVTSTGDGATVLQDNKVGASKLKGSAGALDNGGNADVLQSNGDGTFSWRTLGNASGSNVNSTALDASSNLPTSSVVKSYVDNLVSGLGAVKPAVADIATLQTLAVSASDDKALCLVENAGLYRLDYQGVDAPNGDTVVSASGGVGRWYKISATINDHANLSNVNKINGGDYHVPNIPNNTTTFLRGDGTWAIPPTYTHPNHTGEVTSVNDGTTTIQPNVISANKMKGVSGGALANGTAGQLLKSNGDGTFDWTDAPSASQVNYTFGASLSGRATNVGVTPVIIDSFAKATFRSARYLISAFDVINNRFETLEILVVHDGTTAYYTEFGNVMTPTPSGVTFTVAVNGANVELSAQGASANNTITFVREALNV